MVPHDSNSDSPLVYYFFKCTPFDLFEPACCSVSYSVFLLISLIWLKNAKICRTSINRYLKKLKNTWWKKGKFLTVDWENILRNIRRCNNREIFGLSSNLDLSGGHRQWGCSHWCCYRVGIDPLVEPNPIPHSNKVAMALPLHPNIEELLRRRLLRLETAMIECWWIWLLIFLEMFVLRLMNPICN